MLECNTFSVVGSYIANSFRLTWPSFPYYQVVFFSIKFESWFTLLLTENFGRRILSVGIIPN
jgi:hypothetical protein